MITRTTALAITLLMALPGIVLAHPTADVLEIQVALTKDVRSGMTIDEAVAHQIDHAPAEAKKIVATALDMLHRLPSRACIARSGNTTRAPRPDYKACSSRVIQAAILAGGDPIKVAKASSTAGDYYMANYQPERNAKNFYLRRLFLLGSS